MTPQPHVDRTMVGPHIIINSSLKVNTCNRCGEYVLSDYEFEYYELRAAKEVLSGMTNLYGDIIRFIRKALGLRSWMFAEELGITQDQMVQWELNKDPNHFGEDINIHSKINDLVTQKLEDLRGVWIPITNE